MDTTDGRIYTPEQMAEMFKNLKEVESPLNRMIEMQTPPTKKQMERKPPRVGRNDPCPCGSGKKFKKCHYMSEGGEIE